MNKGINGQNATEKKKTGRTGRQKIAACRAARQKEISEQQQKLPLS
jgi:hypothetical protein